MHAYALKSKIMWVPILTTDGPQLSADNELSMSTAENDN